MTVIERIAAFLKDRDECLTPDEADDAERVESAREILRTVIGPDRSIDLAEILRALGEESMIMQPGITMTLNHEPRTNGRQRSKRR